MNCLSRSVFSTTVNRAVCSKVAGQQLSLFFVVPKRKENGASHASKCFSTSRKHFQEISSQKVNVNGVNLHYEIAGIAPDVILCMPGALGTTRSDFGPQLNGLSDKFTVVVFDPRGYGKSIPPKRDFPQDFYDRDADDAANLMLTIGYKKFSVLGWSDGGNSGMILAGQRPELVEKLVVCGSNSFVTDEDAKMVEPIRDLSKWSAKMREPLEALYGKEGLQEIWNGWINVYLGFRHTKHGGDICTSFLPKIECPALVIHGEKDPVVPRLHPEYIVENIKNAKFHSMPDGKHNLHLKYHEEFNELVTEFLLSP